MSPPNPHVRVKPSRQEPFPENHPHLFVPTRCHPTLPSVTPEMTYFVPDGRVIRPLWAPHTDCRYGQVEGHRR